MTEIDEAIELSEYQATWPRVFAEEQARICQLLDIPGEDLEHTGSTAVPGSSHSVGKRWARQAYRVGCTFGCGRASGEPTRCTQERSALGQQPRLSRLLAKERARQGTHANAKHRAVDHGARTLLRYSAEKADCVNTLLKEALATQR
jgi:GrpB-like predicted nucleotidyltransferase (UPF0157 family)